MSGAAPVRGVLVVIPARNEEALLEACLDSVRVAVETLHATRPGLPTHVVVVADRCTDRTAEIAHRAGASVVAVDQGCVGAARGAGVAAGLALLTDMPEHEVWVASTDADTRVPPRWLHEQLDLADAGIGLVLGRAVPDPEDLDTVTLKSWHELHTSTVVGVHVHGANLGFRADGYRAVGGWPWVPEHEDQLLVAALLGTGVPAAAGPDVTTSGRLRGRAPGGFAGYLSDLTHASGAVQG